MNLSATMDLKAGAFLGPLAQVRGAMAGTVAQGWSLAKMVTGIGGAFAAFKSAESIVTNFFSAFERGDRLATLSRITGESVRNLVMLEKGFKVVTGSADSMQQRLASMQRALGGVNEQGEPTKFIFDQLGLSIDKLKKLDAPTAIVAIGEKIRALATPAERTAAAMAIFGRGGADMVAVLDDPQAFQEAMRSAKGLGDLYQRNARVFSEITRMMNSIRGKAAGLFAGLAEGAAPAFKAVLEWVKKIDLEKLGRDLGGVVAAIPRALEQGRIAELVQLSLQVGFAKAVNYLTALMQTSMGVMSDVLSLTFTNLGGITDVLVGAAAQFGAALLNAVKGPMAFVQGIMEEIASMSLKDWMMLGQPGNFVRHSMTAGFRGRQILENGGPTFGFGGEPMNAQDIAAGGRAQVTRGLTALRQPLAEMVSGLMERLRGFSVTDVAGAGELATQLKALVKALAPVTTPPTKEPERNGQPLAGVSMPKIEGDRLAKIGLFIGGGAPALDYARRTAENTQRMVEQLRQLPRTLKESLSTDASGAVWVG